MCEDAAFRLDLLDPLDRLPYSKMAGVGRVAQSIDDPHVEALGSGIAASGTSLMSGE